MPALTKAQRAMMSKNKDDLKLTALPGIGPRIGKYLNDMGFYRVGDLKGENAEDLYARNNVIRDFEDDPCFLYVFRMAIYFAEHDVQDPELLQWWRWRRPDEGPQGEKHTEE